MTKKITKKMVLQAMQATIYAAEDINFGMDVTKEDVLKYIQTSIEQIDSKAERAKERKEKAKQTGDELRAAVLSVLKDEFMTLDEVTSAVEANYYFEELTRAKVTARLSQLFKAGKIKKEQQKTDGRKTMTYALCGEQEQEEED